MPMGVKLGTEEGTEDQHVEYKHPAGAYTLHDFHKINTICASFQYALVVKVSLNLPKGLRSYRGFNLTGSGYPTFSVPLTFWWYKNVLDVLYHHAKFGGARISPAAGAAKNVEFFICPSRCVVRHAFERQSLFARFHHEGVGVQK